MHVEQGFNARLIRTFGFAKKELFSVFRQPRLLLTLVIAPFLILLIFGLGYRTTPPPFKTVLVLGNDQAQLAGQEDLDEAFGEAIILEDTTTDREAAQARLESGDIDMLIIAPDDPLGSLDAGEKADFEVVHTASDPVLRASIELLARLSVDEINRRVLSDVITTAQAESEDIEEPLATLQDSSDTLVAALEAGDRAGASEQIDQLRSQLALTQRRTASSDSLYRSVGEALGYDQEQAFSDLETDLETASAAQDEDALQAARDFQESISELETGLQRAQDLDPNLLVSPFGAEVTQLYDLPIEPGIYYSPGTVVLLIQHLALTFAALSLVRDRQLGLTEVFRVSPLASGEAMTGKYLGFGSIAVVVTAALTGAMLLFGITVQGSWWMFAAVMGLVIVASLGLGFLLSGASQTDSQAVQYSMMVLLVSIFFTGFVLPLDQLVPGVQVISYLIPATYGIRALQDLVFTGAPVDPLVVGGLAAYALLLMVGAWFVVRRDVVSAARV